MQETELKLELSQAGAVALLKKNPFESAPTVLQLKSIYFDTPRRDLSKRGVSLRIRQSGNERIQTVKAGSGVMAGLFDREEWERAVAGDEPELDDPQVQALLVGVGPGLAPLFEVHVKRHRWNVTEGDSTVEVVLDVGRVVAADRETPFCEVELEMKAGSAMALFDLARRIGRIVPVRLGVLSKAERGYRLLGAVPGPVKAGTVPLSVEMNAASAFARIASGCLRQFRLNQMALDWSRDPDAVHQLRVALRRLRSLFSICKSLFEDSRFDQLREELRWLAGETGQVRNIDVMIARVTNEDLSERLQRARDGAYATLQISLSSARTRSLVIDVAEFISDERRSGGSQEALCGQPSRDFATTVLDKLWKKVAKSGSNLVDADDGTRHRLRIAAKKLRYAAEFFEPLFKSKAEAKRHRRFITAVAGLQDQLGVLNDLATALDRLSALELLDVAGAEDLVGAGDKTRLLHDAAKAYDRVVHTKRFWC
ncbi:inorganic triphosphatase YgiF [Ochrobactrum daejeonense]|uniref:Inorganic triphosphatase YgiF n=1 Tax=Brucella daejeonensis TaxID=659015 RepID=A0A7W9AUG2_9HYPH|nr:inorganic triphosphatase [Brucella daejeonensis]MBB5700736.1 inorganic triphosphatase YgiF [Brucella daejeonensis]